MIKINKNVDNVRGLNSSEKMKDFKDDDCSVCRGGESGVLVTHGKGLHVFHEGCLNRWVVHSLSRGDKPCCPTCPVELSVSWRERHQKHLRILATGAFVSGATLVSAAVGGYYGGLNGVAIGLVTVQVALIASIASKCLLAQEVEEVQDLLGALQ